MAKTKSKETYIETIERQHAAISEFLPGTWSARFGQIVGKGGFTVAAGMDAEAAQYIAGLHNALPGILRHIKALEEIA